MENNNGESAEVEAEVKVEEDRVSTPYVFVNVYDQEMLDKIAMVKRQTNYGNNDDDLIAERLVAHGGDAIKVIKEHLGLPIDKKKDGIVSLNQEIYKQFREKLHIAGKQF
jgi:hypothetical protein